jgi:putative ABC transport system permease protein
VKTLALALRNLLRNRRRSLTTILAMIVGAQAILLFGGYSRNITYGLQTDFVRRGGHLQIQRQGYFLYGAGNPVAYGIADYERVMDAVKNDPVLAPMLTVVTPTQQLGGIAGNFAAGVSRTVFASGTVVDDQNRMLRWNDYGFPVPSKPVALTGTSLDSAVIGAGVARVLQLCGPLEVKNCQTPPTAAASGKDLPSDIAALASEERASAAKSAQTRIELLAASAHGAPNVATLNVVKAVNLGVKEIDDAYIGLHLAQAQRLVYGAAAPRVTAIVLQLKHTLQIPAAKARLRDVLARVSPNEPLEALDFETLNPFYGQALGFFRTIFGFIAVLMGAIVLFTVVNTMSMAVFERTVEIGTLRAMGLRRRGVRWLFVSEGLLLGIFGAILGVIIATAIAAIINKSGLTWTPPGRQDAVPLIIRVWGEIRLVIGTVIGLTAIAAISAWWPARRAARMNIVEALRHV